MGITMGAYIDQGGHVDGHMRDAELHPGIDRLLLTGSDQAREIAGRIDKAEFVDGWDALLARDGVPLILMLTRNRDAGGLTLAAVEAGRRVYGEKPGARTAEDMQRIVDACARTGAHYTPCYVRRTMTETQEVRRLIEAGALGKLWSFQASWITWSAELRGVDQWLFDGEIAGGGIIYWLACHWIDLLRYVTGERIVAVSAMTATMEEHISVEDVACLTARLEGGAIGTIRCGYLRNPSTGGYDDHQLMTAYEGSHGAITHIPQGPVTVRVISRAEGFAPGEQRDLHVATPRRGGYAYALLDEVVAATVEGRAPMIVAEDALYVLRVAEAAYEASRSGREVEVG